MYLSVETIGYIIKNINNLKMNAMKLHLQQLKMMKILFSLDESLIYVKTRLPFATTSIHISSPELMDKTKNMSTGQNLNGEKTIPIATATSLHSSAQETPEPITETPTTNNHENRASMDKMEDNTNKLKANRTTKSKSMK
jgi:hypothetical protein